MPGDRPPSKSDCPGCVARQDPHGRFPIGFCGPGCLRRQWRDGLLRWDATRREYVPQPRTGAA